jgi:8-oxo-dGTP pyrophosphatase MutT (NUDIX family)
MAVMRTDLRGVLREALARNPPRPEPRSGDRLAAVLALVAEEPEPTLLFTERTSGMSRHPGEVSFPGGLQDPGDADLAATALREAAEEIGLDPTLPELLGALPSVHTYVSGILVTPFVGAVRAYPTLRVSDAEIARVIKVPMRELVDAEQVRERASEGNRVWRGWSYDVEGATIWGATGAMLHAFLQIVRKEAAWLIHS